jgi:hypothetical protein
LKKHAPVGFHNATILEEGMEVEALWTGEVAYSLATSLADGEGTLVEYSSI